MRIVVVLILALATAALTPENAQISKPGCEDRCGNVSIPYPFGTRKGCYLDPTFFINCSIESSSGNLTAFLRKGNLQVVNILLEGQLEILSYIAKDCYNSSGPTSSNSSSVTLSNFRISTKNKFIAIGCDTDAFVHGDQGDETYRVGCTSVCDSIDYVHNGTCSGGCCKRTIPEDASSFWVVIRSYQNHSDVLGFNPCSYAFVVEEDKFNFSSRDFVDFGSKETMPTLIDWGIGNVSCEVAEKNQTTYACKGNTTCENVQNGPGYLCRCLVGYEGNPYLDGCKDIDECEDPNNHDCEGACNNTPGNYTCSCPKGYHGDGRKDRKGCIANESMVIKIVISTATSFTFVFICFLFLYFYIKKRNLIKLKENFFRQNGGLMLQQQISGREGTHEAAKVFTADELEKATKNFDESTIIGKGGFGTVYKGILADNRIVAIKKSKIVDQTQIEQFINEVVILSQVNHRNVVKLFGCCLETQVPLLVYEFITNGTLSDHIHNDSKASVITWDIRIRIATETAGALSYLHSEASIPIIHRDVKPMNILLDNNYTTKVSDFGASRLIPMDQIELATIVQGTLGYLDPEYLLSSQLTEKSDVYSFGVVLVELLTGKKALCFERPEEERNLATYFLSSLKEDHLFQILDDRIAHYENSNEVVEVARLAKRCISLNGEERPTMKEVAIELEGILKSVIQKHPWVNATSNEEETEYLLSEPSNDNRLRDEGNSETTTVYDSMSKQALFPLDSGR